MTSCCGPSRVETPRARANVLTSNYPKDIGLTWVELPGGSFQLGADDQEASVEDGESPSKRASVEPFAISATTVTNAQFAAFVDETEYQTGAEVERSAFVFKGLLKSRRAKRSSVRSVPSAPWWFDVRGADWRHPEGTRSSIKKRLDHPVVQVNRHDAEAFCNWAGCRLATEAEWEFAARGGIDSAKYPWGNKLMPNGEHRCNIWQGRFPDINTAADGYIGTAPAKSYKPNGYQLYNMTGNVWEWTSSSDANQAVLRGGSYLCHQSYCQRYRVSSRYRNDPNTALGNCGFRVVRDH